MAAKDTDKINLMLTGKSCFLFLDVHGVFRDEHKLTRCARWFINIAIEM